MQLCTRAQLHACLSILLRSLQALLNIISNPVNSTVPITAEVMKAAGVYDPRKARPRSSSPHIAQSLWQTTLACQL